ncbi:hypothetical protein VOLCADRAFT_117043 [Volvox carteri f. nagariensis]|uniref:Uncharacterized protein n=1 Tax=Volvox carteri f. nagariensis TaxID=3068 RepID=D8TRQ3_VOLCA|nr:uncharacterized protein VOLCADRAFT_117043 [Volvox carteri f. nagariensis]EFJ50028.1 hypothetical protein VOLCADRAFT_117043 [Volvox carteri f. nagariensis]|eukprot:XP_002949093.1 hypothetical protein VOLCADRAFT_117043 [Volvox carteri f. nagariensis]
MAALTADLNITKCVSKDGKLARRSMGFWCQFNCWYRTFWEAEGRRPTVIEVKRTHSKCLRSLEQVRSYFRQYRAARKDDPGADGASFRGAKLRRSSTELDTVAGSQVCSQSLEHVGFLRDPGAAECLSVLATGTNTLGVALANGGIGQGFVGDSTRTISTGATPRGSGQTSVSGTITTRSAVHSASNNSAAAGRAPPFFAVQSTPRGANCPPVQGPSRGATGVWLHGLSDAPVPGSQQQAGSSWQPASVSIQPIRQHPSRPPALPPSGCRGCTSSALPPSILLSSSSDALGSPAQGAGQPPRPPAMALPQLRSVPGLPLNVRFSAASVPGGHFPCQLEQAEAREVGMTPLDVATGHAASAAPCGLDSTMQGQPKRAVITGQEPILHFATAAVCLKEKPQDMPLATATTRGAATVPAPAATVSAPPVAAYPHPHYHHHHHHPMTHLGYDSVYGHPAYMDPYAYSYAMHDPNMGYWRMYPYCYTIPPHPAHVLYPEVLPHVTDYRDPCYGAMPMLVTQQCTQLDAAEMPQPESHHLQIQARAASAATVHHGGVTLDRVEASRNAFELARCAAVHSPQQLNALTPANVDNLSAGDGMDARACSAVPSGLQQPLSPYLVHGPFQGIGAGHYQPGLASVVSPAAGAAALSVQRKQQFAELPLGTPASRESSGMDIFAGVVTPSTSALLSELNMLLTDGVCDCSL